MAAAGPAVTADPDIQLTDVPYLYEFAYCYHDNQDMQTILAWGLSDTALNETHPIPGHSDVNAMRASINTKMILRKMYHSLWLVHRSGLTLRGQFTAASFRLDPLLNVRFYGIHLSTLTVGDGNADYLAFMEAVEAFYSLEDIPPDIQQWLDLIHRGVCGSEYLIRYNVALMLPREQVGSLMSSHRMFMQLRLQDPVLYQRIIWGLRGYSGWNVNSYCVNSLMSRTRNHINPWTGRIATFQRDIRGVLWLVRNCWQHPGRDCDEDLFPLVINDDFPELLQDFQEAFFRAGLLPRLQLEAIMG